MRRMSNFDEESEYQDFTEMQNRYDLIDHENLEISDIEMMKLMIDALSREIIEHTIGLFIISLQRYHIQVMIG